MKSTWFPSLILLVLAATAAAIPILGRAAQSDEILLHARLAEDGGWSPASLTAQVGVPLRLRLTSDDVLHSFAVGQTNWPVVEVKPGEVTATTLLFDQPGKYTYSCTRWCGPNHWRMRGTIEVTGSASEAAGASVPESEPLFLALKLDLDAPHPASVVPEQKPAAGSGAALLPELPVEYRKQDFYRTHSPAEIFTALRAEPALVALPDRDLWDVVAALWRTQTNPQALEEGRQLYAQNCAACHGENGQGDGVFAETPAGGSRAGQVEQIDGHEVVNPADFTDPASMLGASPAVLQGKILRGGMGTGMPYWGPIFTEDQIWALVAYLQSFQFNLEVNP